MSIWRKLLYYLLGVGLGVLAVMFIFGDRDIQCSYFPNDRVLYDLRKKERLFPEDVMTRMEDAGIDTSHISRLLWNGKVDFSKSNTELDSCKTYWISLRPEGEKAFSILVENCDSTATFLDFQTDL